MKNYLLLIMIYCNPFISLHLVGYFDRIDWVRLLLKVSQLTSISVVSMTINQCSKKSGGPMNGHAFIATRKTENDG